MKEKMRYDEAVAELENIVKKIEDPNVNIDNVEELIKRAMELVAYCKRELAGYEESFSALLEKE